ncbi:MAG: acyltransferase, partial [Planctomycetes bacterium]|nr:acyltransferase [Planctomycetota bacterium]
MTSPSQLLSGRHIPVLDGVRGLAVLLVMLQHFFHGIDKAHHIADDVVFGVAGRAWMGVDLFFVLS